MREVEIYGLGIEAPGARPVLLLQELAGARRVLPIWIGVPEAGAVEMARAHLAAPRPGSHQLIADVVGRFDRRLVRASVTELVGSTFHAELVFDGGVRISARPSDAVVIALLLDAPLEVAEALLDVAGVDRSTVIDARGVPDASGDGPGRWDEDVARFRRFLDTATPEDFEPN